LATDRKNVTSFIFGNLSPKKKKLKYNNYVSNTFSKAWTCCSITWCGIASYCKSSGNRNIEWVSTWTVLLVGQTSTVSICKHIRCRFNL